MSSSPQQTIPLKLDSYAIHYSDSPSTILVTHLLSGDNYGPWSRAITMALRAKNKLGFVDGSLSVPEEEDDIPNLQRCNDLVASWILNSVSPEIRPNILYAETTTHIWIYLKDQFSQSSAPKIYQLKQSIYALKQDDMSVSLYFTQLKFLWYELSSMISVTPCICGNAKSIIDKQNQDRAMGFLQGLHDHFSAMCSQILLIDPFPSIQRIYVKKKNNKRLTLESVLLLIQQHFRHINHCLDHRENECPLCEHCNKNGHTLATCYQIHGFPDNHVKKSGPPSCTSATFHALPLLLQAN